MRKVTKGFGIGGLDLTAYLDVRNILNFRTSSRSSRSTATPGTRRSAPTNLAGRPRTTSPPSATTAW